MPGVLLPRLEGFGVKLPVIGGLNERVPQQMRIEIRQSGTRAGFAENLADRVGVGPRRAIERHRAECEVVAGRDLGFREQRVVGSKALLLAKIGNPADNDLSYVVTDRKRSRREGLRPLCAHVARVVLDQIVLNVDMLQQKRDDRPITRAGQDREGDQRAVAPLDIRPGRRGLDHGANLRDRRANLEPPRGRDSRQIARRVEVLVVGILDPRRKAPLIREPDEERLQAGERRVGGRGRERFACPLIGGGYQVSLESRRLTYSSKRSIARSRLRRWKRCRGPLRP